ncbi:GH15591 [Drosophila grimshawi]|uniref:GH15591 n=1 Tax=Drosophila grimshawi TaxID=7222 RepID=B4J0V3_DROGR|nr:GH15591 [Drosophila grimshawi]
MSNQLFFLSLADIFSVYPAIFKERSKQLRKTKQIYLPSDEEWQDKRYFMLLEIQRQVNDSADKTISLKDIDKREKPVFDPQRITKILSPSISPNGRKSRALKHCHATTVRIKLKASARWNLPTIANAAKLLKKPPLPVVFQNEHEMRLAYSLIYDVFRYKTVLCNALSDICFFEQERYKKYIADEQRIWLMLFELYDRHFKNRNSEMHAEQAQLYQDAEVAEIAAVLWQHRIRLAASISRMRIAVGALRLSQLLPIHLQNEKVAIAAANPVITGWINPFLVRNKAEADKLLIEMGFTVHGPDDEQPLLEQHCKWDNICPLVISIIPKDRGEFTKSSLMTKHRFIMQDKNFSYGPAIMSKLMDYYELYGDILQTHVDSPRSTAYLAALFYSVNRVNNFYVYGAGANLKEYRRYMETIGVNNIRLFGDAFTSFPMESNRFRNVIGVFATPPNSFSAISDPIDLICSRGGDLSMLEVLTESEVSDDGRQRVGCILEEQLLTLTMSMSRPQIQFVLYQTHSIVNTENEDMVQHVIEVINKLALEKHRHAYKEMKRLEAIAEAEAANIPAAAMSKESPRKKDKLSAEDKRKSQPELTAKPGEPVVPAVQLPRVDSIDLIVTPDIDEFVLDTVPDICINQDNCIQLQSTGSYLSLIRRKSITQLNEKYLIRMAERRGLFGKQERDRSKSRAVKLHEINEPPPPDTAYDNCSASSRSGGQHGLASDH